MTLKTTKEQRDKLLRRLDLVTNAMPNASKTVLVVDEEDIRDLCHDADRAGGLEVLYEQRGLYLQDAEATIADLRAKLDEAYENAARVCEADAEMQRSVGNQGAAGNLINAAAAIRALKKQEKV